MNTKECTQALEKAMEKLEDIKEDVKAFIVLAVTDEESLDGTANAGVNAVCGKGDDVINLLANLPNELILSTAIAMTRKALLSFEKEEDDDTKSSTLN
jgi:prophage DNA circulation protein